jgi:hypothetical protein
MEDIFNIPELRNKILYHLDLYDLYTLRFCNKLINTCISDFSNDIINQLIQRYQIIIYDKEIINLNEKVQFLDLYYIYYYINSLFKITNDKESYDQFINILKNIKINYINHIPNVTNVYILMDKLVKYPFYLEDDYNIHPKKRLQKWMKKNNKWIVKEKECDIICNIPKHNYPIKTFDYLNIF